MRENGGNDDAVDRDGDEEMRRAGADDADAGGRDGDADEEMRNAVAVDDDEDEDEISIIGSYVRSPFQDDVPQAKRRKM